MALKQEVIEARIETRIKNRWALSLMRCLGPTLVVLNPWLAERVLNWLLRRVRIQARLVGGKTWWDMARAPEITIRAD